MYYMEIKIILSMPRMTSRAIRESRAMMASVINKSNNPEVNWLNQSAEGKQTKQRGMRGEGRDTFRKTSSQ